YSPTSEQGKVTGSTPAGSVDYPFNPLSVALGAEATFVARAIDTDKPGLTGVLRRAATHKGAAFVEILQNCNIYNDGAFDVVRERERRRDRRPARRPLAARLPAAARRRHDLAQPDVPEPERRLGLRRRGLPRRPSRLRHARRPRRAGRRRTGARDRDLARPC